MKVGFLGRSIGIKKCIEKLLKNNYEIVFIVTEPSENHQKDNEIYKKQLKRGLYESIFEIAKSYKLPLRETYNVNEKETIEWVKSFNADIIVSAGCRSIIRKNFLEECGAVVLNLHTAPLPKYRGRASDSWMILNDEKTAHGVCHFVDEGIDSGDILAREPFEIPEGCYPIDIFEKRMSIIGDLLLNALRNLSDPEFRPVKQLDSDVTYFPGLNTERDGWIDWTQDAASIERHVRAFGNPYAGAHTFYKEERIVVLRGYVDNSPPVLHPRTTGLIFGYDGNGGMRVATGNGVYIVSQIQNNGRVATAQEALRLGSYFEVKKGN